MTLFASSLSPDRRCTSALRREFAPLRCFFLWLLGSDEGPLHVIRLSLVPFQVALARVLLVQERASDNSLSLQNTRVLMFDYATQSVNLDH